LCAAYTWCSASCPAQKYYSTQWVKIIFVLAYNCPLQVTNERCPKCSNDRAYFMQIQTRSADEPMTIFYRCANVDCAHRWKD
uniref:DNA-directed RNA polymerase III subunit RPC10 n=1 Tax=Haemonchus placei TaxID=6290 RepID=A0A0N4WWJ4_HAEPC